MFSLRHFTKTTGWLNAYKKTGIIKPDFLCYLALLNDFRTFDWASEYKYPTVVLDQMKEMLAKYANV